MKLRNGTFFAPPVLISAIQVLDKNLQSCNQMLLSLQTLSCWSLTIHRLSPTYIIPFGKTTTLRRWNSYSKRLATRRYTHAKLPCRISYISISPRWCPICKNNSKFQSHVFFFMWICTNFFFQHLDSLRLPLMVLLLASLLLLSNILFEFNNRGMGDQTINLWYGNWYSIKLGSNWLFVDILLK